MGKLIPLLNAGTYGEKGESFSKWVNLGEPIALNKMFILHVFRECIDGEDLTIATISRGSQFHSEGYLRAGEAFDATKVAGVLIIPRALEYDANARVSRVFVQFVPTTDYARKAIKRNQV